MSSNALILVVDDDPIIAKLATSGLQRRGYQVTKAPNAEAALGVLQEQAVSLALIDVHMPGRNGFDLTRAIRNGEAGRSLQQIPVLMLTGSDDVDSIDRAFDAGATDFITKPINLALLAERVRYALQGASREKALRDAQAEQANACKLARLGFWRLDGSDCSLNWSTDATEVLQRDDLPSSTPDLIEWVASKDRLRLNAALNTALEGGAGIDLEVSVGTLENVRRLRLQSSPVNEDNQLVGAFQDVTELRAFENRAAYLAEYDDLTDLPKRRLFLKLLDEQLTAEPDLKWLIVVFDISRLHRINDLLGIPAGDEVLAIFSQRLKQNTPDEALLCRLEADTFCTAVPLASDGDIQKHYQSWMQTLARACVVEGTEIFVDFTSGASLYPSDAANGKDLLRGALAAQRAARFLPSTNRLTLFESIDIEDDAGTLKLESDLRQALARDEFFLVYQPQKCLVTGNIVGAEALLRWRHSHEGIISPARFIPLLEENGLIVEVGEWVMKEACRQLSEWQKEGGDLRMGVNVSALQFEQEGLAERMARYVALYDLQPHHFELEITESTAMKNPDVTLSILHDLRSHGFKLAIDDFGTGHSSYEYLLRFPLHTLKIDRSFVKGVAENRENRAIIRSLTALSRGLGLKTIAEGIETQRQQDYLDALDVQEIQGFLFAKPMEPKDFFPFYLQNGSSKLHVNQE